MPSYLISVLLRHIRSDRKRHSCRLAQQLPAAEHKSSTIPIITGTMEVDWDMSDDDAYEGPDGIIEGDYEEDTLEQLQEDIERLQEGDGDDSNGNAAQIHPISRFLSCTLFLKSMIYCNVTNVMPSAIWELNNRSQQNRAIDNTSATSRLDEVNTIQGLTTEQFRRLIELVQTSPSAVQNRLDAEERQNRLDAEEEEDEVDDLFSRPAVDIAEIFKKVTEPQADGLGLLMSGEFGRVKHQYRSRSKNKNVSKLLMNRATKVRPEYPEDLVSV